MHHTFDVDLAKKYGVIPAVLLEYFAYWVIYNRATNQNLVDGRFWTFNSVSAMQEQFPYLSARQLGYAIDKLKKDKLILVRKLSTDKMNTTCWYTLSAEGERVCGATESFGKRILQNCEMQETNLSNDKDLIHYTITNNTLLTNNPPTPHAKKAAEKVEYAEYVKMKPTEYQKLVDEYGEATAKEFISILDNYKGAKGVTYKDDYRAIHNWVIKRWREEHQERQQPKTFAERDRDNFLNTIKEMDDLYGSK